MKKDSAFGTGLSFNVQFDGVHRNKFRIRRFRFGHADGVLDSLFHPYAAYKNI
jgi:hypothetical protein